MIPAIPSILSAVVGQIVNGLIRAFLTEKVILGLVLKWGERRTKNTPATWDNDLILPIREYYDSKYK